MLRLRDSSGQASVEFVALLPLVVVLGTVLWQMVVAGQAAWSSAGAARAAARAHAVGGDPVAAARGALPDALRGGVRVRAVGEGGRVAVAVPLILTGTRLATIDSSARLPPQR